MAAESTKALVKRSTDMQLMPPPAKRIKRPQKVLDEESYVAGISEIIARDFFPGLLETETQQEYLDALESKDNAWISSASSRLTQVMTPGRKRGRRGTSIQTPLRASDTPRGYAGDTPMTVISEISTASAQVPAKEEVDTNMSLDAFQSKYTSEDNESFYKLLDTQNQERAEKYAWMWMSGNKIPSDRLLKQKEVKDRLISAGISLVDDGGKRNRLAIEDVKEKPAMPDSWKAKPNNNLMFGPDGVEDSVQTVAQKAQSESRAAPKGVNHGNTRLPDPELKVPEIPPSPSLSAIQDAIARKPRWSESESGYSGPETPRVNGYTFVDEEPEPHEYQKELPLIELGKGDLTPNPFKIKERSKREDLHHRMVDKTAEAKRASSRVGMTGKVDQTPVPNFPSSPRVGIGGLTPAAQRLWSKVGSKPTPSRFGNVTPGLIKPKGSGLKTGWTAK